MSKYQSSSFVCFNITFTVHMWLVIAGCTRTAMWCVTRSQQRQDSSVWALTAVCVPAPCVQLRSVTYPTYCTFTHFSTVQLTYQQPICGTIWICVQSVMLFHTTSFGPFRRMNCLCIAVYAHIQCCQGWRNQLSVLSESYICCSGQVTFSSWLVRGQVKKSKPKCLKSKNTFISENVAADIKVERERKHLVMELIQVKVIYKGGDNNNLLHSFLWEMF